jgi:hypothetical protein
MEGNKKGPICLAMQEKQVVEKKILKVFIDLCTVHTL